MKGRRHFWMLFGTALFVMCSLVLVFVLSGAFRKPASQIVLPDPSKTKPAGLDGLSPVFLNESAAFLAMELSPANVLAVLESLQRPEAFSAAYHSTLFSGQNEAKTETAVFVRNGVTRLEIRPPQGRPFVQLITESYVYSFEPTGFSAVQTARGEFSADFYGGLPSLESLADPLKTVTFCAVEQEGEGFFIRVTAQNGAQTENYTFSLATGMLTEMDVSGPQGPQFSLSLGSFSAETPEEGLFLLPSGQKPQ